MNGESTDKNVQDAISHAQSAIGSAKDAVGSGVRPPTPRSTLSRTKSQNWPSR